MKCFRTCVAAMFAALFSTVGLAAPVVFNFAVYDPLDAANQMTVNGLTVTVSAGSTFNTGPAVVHEDNNAASGYDGLGVDSGQGDGSNNDVNNGTNSRYEWLTFAFSAPVWLDRISFTNVDSNDDFLLGFGPDESNLVQLGGVIDLGSGNDVMFDVMPDLLASVFRITATTGSTADFRITGLTVIQAAAVPEPTSLGLAAFAGLAIALGARRRKLAVVSA